MITNKVIESIYKKYKNRPSSTDELNIALLFEKAGVEHDINIDFDSDELVINSINHDSPFHRIPLMAIHQIIEFDAHVAIVMHSSIIFLHKEHKGVSVHIKHVKPTMLSRMKDFFGRSRCAAL